MSDFISYNQMLSNYFSETGENTENPKDGSDLGSIQPDSPNNVKNPEETSGENTAADVTSQSYLPADIPMAGIFNIEDKWEDIEIDDLRTADNAAILREESSRTLSLFLYNLVPMFVTNAVNMAAGIAGDISSPDLATGVAAIVGKVNSAVSLAHKLSYFTPAEMALYAITSAVTLTIYREFTIKRQRTDPFKGTLVESFDADPQKNLEFGSSESKENVFKIIAGGPRAWASTLIDALTKSSSAFGGTEFINYRRNNEYWSDTIAAIFGSDSKPSYHHRITKDKEGDKSYDFYKISAPSPDTELHGTEENSELSDGLKNALYETNARDRYKIWNVNEEGQTYSLNIHSLRNDLAIHVMEINRTHANEKLKSYSSSPPITGEQFDEQLREGFHASVDVIDFEMPTTNDAFKKIKEDHLLDIAQRNIDFNSEKVVSYETLAPKTSDKFDAGLKEGFHAGITINGSKAQNIPFTNEAFESIKADNELDIVKRNTDSNKPEVVKYESQRPNVKENFDSELGDELYSTITIDGSKAQNIPFTNEAFEDIKKNNSLDLSRLRTIHYSAVSRDTILDEITRPTVNKIGYIKVLPVARTGANSFKIPFEFNPNISEMSYAATYEAMAILGRTGEIQTFVKSNGVGLTIETQYFATSYVDENNEVIKPDSDNRGNGWMDLFSLNPIQAIEAGYKSLVYPAYEKSEDNENGYFYFKPPVVKIIFGSEEATQISGRGPYSNLLTYPFHLNNSTKIYHKTFAASNISINKSIEANPLFVDENENFLDTFGFQVSIQLIEMDPSYINVQPSFTDYYHMGRNMIVDTEIGDYING